MLSMKSELEAQLIRLCRAERTRFEPALTINSLSVQGHSTSYCISSLY